MKNKLISNFFNDKIKQYIFIILTATILSIIFFTKSYSEEKVFTVDNIIVEGKVDLNFSRDKYIKKALDKSFELLMSKILLTSDIKKVKNINKVKYENLVNSFQIIEEVYSKDKYLIKVKVNYSENKVKKLLSEKNISFSNPKKISAVFFPILFLDNKIKTLMKIFFTKNGIIFK